MYALAQEDSQMNPAQHSHARSARIVRRITVITAASLLLGACAQVDGPDLSHGSFDKGNTSLAKAGSNDMNQALNYWGRKYVKSPSDKMAALNYAKNLKAAGQSKQAFLVLQQASVLHGNDREIASEYGRLALEADQVQLAGKLLALADDRTSPDWRIVSGRGAALAKQGKYKESIVMFERAHQLAPANPTVMNNLAMAHAGDGNLQKAEYLLRQAAQNPMAKAKVNKNLALVLNLQGRKAEAQAVPRKRSKSIAMRKSLKAAKRPAQKPLLARATLR
mgnify:CR=1 FL=1